MRAHPSGAALTPKEPVLGVFPPLCVRLAQGRAREGASWLIADR